VNCRAAAREATLGCVRQKKLLYPQGVRGIRKAAKLLTAAQAPRTAQINFNHFFNDKR